MKFHSAIYMGLLSFLFGCKSDSPGDFAKKDGVWYYKKTAMTVPAGETLVALNNKFAKSASAAYFMSDSIAEADAATFVPLTEHYAKDKLHVFYCDTYRKGQEYYITAHPRSRVIPTADPATFRMLDEQYARDKTSAFYEGTHFVVKDIESFEVLAGDFSRDKLSGYFMRKAIVGSDGSTFHGVAHRYSKDSAHVYFSEYSADSTARDDPNSSANRPAPKTTILAGADPATFAMIDEWYARDAKHVFYDGRALTDSPATFHVLSVEYAKSASTVYYMGDVVNGADAATFELVPFVDSGPSAKDKFGPFLYAKRMKP